MLASLYYSFTDYNILSKPIYIGLNNYINIFLNDAKFWHSLKITFIFTFISVPLKLIFALLLAVLFNQKHKFVGLYRSIFYVPSLIGSSVAVSIVWIQLFGVNGALNAIFMYLGILDRPIGYIGDPKYSLWTLIILILWQFGSPMLIFLAGLKQIPIIIYEAALIDGCNWRQKFFKITIPMLTPIIFFNLIMQMVGVFMVFTNVYIITKGGPIDSTLLYVLYIYKRGFEYSQMGYASALSWIFLLIVGFITFILFKTSKYWVYYEVEERL
jgi:multiple sugar transport system permease protein